MQNFPEKDWKKLRTLKDKLLKTFCESVFEKLKPVINNWGAESHKAYLKVWEILKKEDNQLALMFMIWKEVMLISN